jgi:hypothetical protein
MKPLQLPTRFGRVDLHVKRLKPKERSAFRGAVTALARAGSSTPAKDHSRRFRWCLSGSALGQADLMAWAWRYEAPEREETMAVWIAVHAAIATTSRVRDEMRSNRSPVRQTRHEASISGRPCMNASAMQHWRLSRIPRFIPLAPQHRILSVALECMQKRRCCQEALWLCRVGSSGRSLALAGVAPPHSAGPLRHAGVVWTKGEAVPACRQSVGAKHAAPPLDEIQSGRWGARREFWTQNSNLAAREVRREGVLLRSVMLCLLISTRLGMFCCDRRLSPPLGRPAVGKRAARRPAGPDPGCRKQERLSILARHGRRAA